MTESNGHNTHRLLLCGLVTVELLSQTYGFYWGLNAISSVLYFGAGLGIALYPMLNRESSGYFGQNHRYYRLAVFLFLLLILYCIWRMPLLLSAAPLDYRQADMLPVIQTMAERKLTGGDIYAPIESIWDGMRPIYLPAMWLPYTTGVWLHMDLRWISLVALLCSLGLIFWGTRREKSYPPGAAVMSGLIPVVLLCFYIFQLNPTLITLSEEPVVIFYYTLLAYGMHRERPVITGLAIALCLLSRYTLVFWVPIYLLYIFLYRSRKAAYITTAALGLALGLLLTLGQAWDQLSFFVELQGKYLEELLDANKSWAFVDKIENNPGLLKFLPFEGIAVWHRLLIYGSIVVPIASFVLFRRYRQRMNEHFFGLCSLKLSFVYFYNMLTIPYSYLFYPSAFLSLFILYAAFSGEKRA